MAVVSSAGETYNYIEIISQTDSRLIYTGKVTLRQYEWSKAGDAIFVDERDAPELLAKRIGTRSCCGAGNGNQVFAKKE